MSKYNGDPDWDGCQAWNSPNAYSQHLQKQIATLRAALERAETEKTLALRQRDRHVEIADQFEAEANTLRAELAAVRDRTLKEWLEYEREQLRTSLDTRLNDWLCEMKEGYDDSIVGFNEAWDIMRKVFKDAALQSHRRTET